ncbi:hypothetical protein GCM10009415_37560 [Chitinophaga japonensis]
MFSCVLVYPAPGSRILANHPAAYRHPAAEISIRYDAKSGKMSIKAADVPLSELISSLESSYQIMLFVTEISLDTRITCNVVDKFIDDALREALPPAARFFYRFKKGDVELEDRRPETKQTGARNVAPTLKARLQAQPAATAIKATSVPVTAKRVARTATLASPATVAGTAAISRTATLAPTAGNMPLRVAATGIRAQQLVKPVTLQQSDDYYVKVVVRVTPNGYEPVSYSRVNGRLVEDSTATSEYVYQLKDNGREVYTGSFQDPLEMHAYSPDGNHKVLQAKEAYINITLPRQVLDKNAIKAPSLEFSKVRGEAVPESRNVKMLQANALQRKGVISTDALQKVIRRQ